ncbi:MAG: sigma-70 family RNA polymerase sigma factor [Bacteroidota bacterium]|nr:sigma-70 family RNA polymerase sigma factor [Bacteroidota bacterium]
MTKEQFQNLFDLYFDDIRRYLYYRSGDATVSTDLAQDTFMRVWEKQMDLLPGRDTGLLYKIAGDLFVSHTRRERLRKEAPKEIRFEQREPTPEEDLNYRELEKKYEEVLMKLPENQRIAFLMSRTEELTYGEIAARLSISVKAVEKRVSGALSRLRKELKPDEPGKRTYR